jgi:hypothetical protein
MKYRQHRSTLAESLKTVVEIPATFDALWEEVRKTITLPETFREDLSMAFYCKDDRTGWDTYIVTIDMYGVVGFTDGPLEDTALRVIR